MNKNASFSLSTAWNYRTHQKAKSLVDEIKSLGFDTIELNFALTEDQVKDFIGLKESGSINISSTHNYCPLPDGVAPKDASPEYYSLSSLDDEERKLAIKFTKKSMDYAKKASAKGLVIHLGRVEIKDRTKKLFAITDKKEQKKEKEEFLLEREEKSAPYFKKAQDSLRALLDYADSIDLNIALENRYYIRELPSFEELEEVFRNFKSEHLFYWHDTGHAQLYENLKVQKHEEYLEAFSSRLLGVHLHDIILSDDHRAPGCGEFDLKRLRPYIKDDTIKVIEAHRKATKEEVKKSRGYLIKELGL